MDLSLFSGRRTVANPYTLEEVKWLFLHLASLQGGRVPSFTEFELLRISLGLKFTLLGYRRNLAKRVSVPMASHWDLVKYLGLDVPTQTLAGHLATLGLESWQAEYSIEHEGRRFRLDFLASEKGFQFAIEVDGATHWSPEAKAHRHQEDPQVSYQKTLEGDRLKTEWCKKAGIPLLRITPHKFFSLQSKELLLSLVENPCVSKKPLPLFNPDSFKADVRSGMTVSALSRKHCIGATLVSRKKRELGLCRFEKGVHFPDTFNPESLQKAILDGLTRAQIQERLGVGKRAVQKYLVEWKIRIPESYADKGVKVTKEWFLQKYLEERLTLKQISKLAGVTPLSALNWKKRWAP